MLKIDTKAPDFTITLGSGERFTLSDQLGRNVVIFFFPRAFTYGCTMEVGGFCESYGGFLASNTVVIGISTDSVERMREFGDHTGAPFALGSDASGEIRRLYDVQRRFGLGTSRVTYVIDAEGAIRGVFHNEFQMGSHVQNALRALENIRAERAA